MAVKNRWRSFTGSYVFSGLFASLLFLAVKGYEFNTGDQAEHLPLVYRMMDPELYPSDYFVSVSKDVFTVRHYYTWLVYLLSFVLPVPVICFILTLGSVWLTAYSVSRITSRFTTDLLAPFIAPVFVLLVFYNFTAGGNHITYHSFICSTAAKALAMYALMNFIYGRVRRSFILLGMASLFQVLVGLQLFMMLFIILLMDMRTEGWRRSARAAAFYLLFASPMLLPVLYRQFFSGGGPAPDSYYRILYVFRNPHHYLPSLFPLNDYLRFLFLTLSGVWFLFLFRIYERKFVIRFIATGAAGMAAYWLLLEILDINQAGKLQWFKVSVWITSFSAMVWAVAAGRIASMVIHEYRLLAAYRAAGMVAVPVLLFLILNSAVIPLEKVQGRYHTGNYRKSDNTLMHEWIEANLPKDAVVFCSPDNYSFPCEAKRSMPSGYKAIIHEPFFMIPWYERFSKLYQVTMDNVPPGNVLKQATGHFHSGKTMQPADLRIDYRLDDLSGISIPVPSEKIVHKEGNIVLTKLR